MKLDANKVTIEWVCNNDDAHEGADDQEIVHGLLSDVPEVGGAICPQCGDDMEIAGVTTEPVGDVDAAERYWIHDTLAEDQPDVPLPFGDNTVGIVDEEQGGVMIYVHEGNALEVLAILRASVA